MSNSNTRSLTQQTPSLKGVASLKQPVIQALRESTWICCLVLALFFCLALASYAPEDPRILASKALEGHIANQGGILGALVADALFSTLGLAAYCIPLVFLALAGYWIRPEVAYSWALVGLMLVRLLGVCLATISLSALLMLFRLNPNMPYGNGGIVGTEINEFGLPLFGHLGFALAFTGLLMVSVSVGLGLSWMKVLEVVGQYSLTLVNYGRLLGVRALSAMRCWLISRVGFKKRASDDSCLGNRSFSSGLFGNSFLVKRPLRRNPFKTLGVINRLTARVAVFLAASVQKLPGIGTKTVMSTSVAASTQEAFCSPEPFDPQPSDPKPSDPKPKSHRMTRIEPTFDIWENEVDVLENEVGVWENEGDAATHLGKRTPGSSKMPPISSQQNQSALQKNQSVHKNQSVSNQDQKVSAKTPTSSQPAKPEPKIESLSKKSSIPIASGVVLPGLELLNCPKSGHQQGYSEASLHSMATLLETKLLDFGVKIEVVAINPGPVITRFEIMPAPGIKASKITNLASDLARSLAMVSVRVVEVIPGKSVMGIEVPNQHRQMVYLQEVLASSVFSESQSPLTFALGHDIAGDPIVADLAKMPHLLVAGTTGSGKSVGVNAMLLSLLYKSKPDAVRLIMIDPKMLELSIYEGIPHLLTPVITDMKEAANGLRWCVAEMERRYQLMAKLGVRNIAGFNKKVTNATAKGESLLDPLWSPETALDPGAGAPALETLPYIVVVIDEFADMMMIVGKKVEELIARIAQKARAAGIHLVLATQRPSVDVITGLIKANVPARIAFQVSSKIDSRTILDQGGAEQLLGQGDMLFLPPGCALPTRVHGAFVADEEVHAVVDSLKSQAETNYIDITSGTEKPQSLADLDDNDPEQDALFDEAVAFVTGHGRVSVSSVQRKLRIGYNRAARLVEAMESSGVVSAPAHNGNREVLAAAPPVD